MAVNPLATYIPEGSNQDPVLQDWAWRRKLAEALAQQAQKSGQGIQHWTQGAAHLVDQLGAGLEGKRLRDEQKAAREGAQKFWEDHLTRQSPAGGPGAASGAVATPTAAIETAATGGPDLRPHIAEAMIPGGGQGFSFDGGAQFTPEHMESVTMPVDNSPAQPALGLAMPGTMEGFMPPTDLGGGDGAVMAQANLITTPNSLPPTDSTMAGFLPQDGGVPREALAEAMMGNHPTTGRPMLPNADGSVSTERTITVGSDGRFFNIPTIVNGQQLSNDDAVAAWRAGRNPEVGSFGSQQEAVGAAESRSQGLGDALQQPLTMGGGVTTTLGSGVPQGGPDAQVPPITRQQPVTPMADRGIVTTAGLKPQTQPITTAALPPERGNARAPAGMSFVTSPGGARLTVNADQAGRFQGLLKDLEDAGYPVRGDQSGGYANRNIRGTNIRSKHADGMAIDVNWTDNPRGGMGKIPADLARSLAKKHGLVWGGDWRNPDPMHFEVPRGAVAMRHQQDAPAKPAQYAQAGAEGQFTTDQLRTMLKNPHLAPMAQRYILEQMGPIGEGARIQREKDRLNLRGMQLDQAVKERELTDPKEKMQVIDGVPYWVNERTQGMRPAQGFQGGPKVPDAIKTQSIKADNAFQIMEKALGRYRALVEEEGAAIIPGKNKDAMKEELRNIQMQFKEMINLGVIQGPDMKILEDMLQDATVSWDGWMPSGVGNLNPFKDVRGRVTSSVDRFRERMVDIRNAQTRHIGLPDIAQKGKGDAAGGGLQPGMRARNPKTGEVIEWNGQAWQSVR